MLESDVPNEPFALFSQWLAEASDAGIEEPHAMTLATVGANGQGGEDENGFAELKVENLTLPERVDTDQARRRIELSHPPRQSIGRAHFRGLP